MATITQYSEYSLLSMAAYGINLATRPDLIQGYKVQVLRKHKPTNSSPMAGK